MNNEVFASVLAGILFGFSALLMWWNKDEPVSAVLLAISGLLMVVHAIRSRKRKKNCILKSQSNEN